MAVSILSRSAPIALVALLSACGGGGDATQSPPRITSSATLQPADYSEVSFTPTTDGYYEISADSDLSFSNTSNETLLVDIDVRAHEVGIPLGYIVGDRVSASVNGGEYWSQHFTSASRHYLFAGTAYRFVIYTINSMSATASVDLTNARIRVAASR